MFKGIWEAIKANKKGIITKALVGAGMLIGTALLSNNIGDHDEDDVEESYDGETETAEDENSEEE